MISISIESGKFFSKKQQHLCVLLTNQRNYHLQKHKVQVKLPSKLGNKQCIHLEARYGVEFYRVYAIRPCLLEYLTLCNQYLKLLRVIKIPVVAFCDVFWKRHQHHKNQIIFFSSKSNARFLPMRCSVFNVTSIFSVQRKNLCTRSLRLNRSFSV
jgi:hypothetical protein